MATAQVTVGVVLERRVAASVWASELWLPVAVLPGAPGLAVGTALGCTETGEWFFGGLFEMELHRTDTPTYRDNLATLAPRVWVAVRAVAEGGMPVVVGVTADPAEGESYTEAGDDIVEQVPMAAEIAALLAAFCAEHHVERAFVKRRQSGLGRRRGGRHGMSDEPDGVLARWSRRKRRALEAPAVVVEELPVEIPPAAETIPLEEITAWLGRRIPDGWREVALRRVWSADTAIRDFVGPADYAWDWNVVGGAPGWGAIRAIDDMARALARAIGEDLPKVEVPLEKVPEPEVGERVAEAAGPVAIEATEAVPEPPSEAPVPGVAPPRRGGRATPV